MSGDPAHGEPILLVIDDDHSNALAALAHAREMGAFDAPVIEVAPEPEKLSPLRAAMARLDARLNGADRRALRRAQNKVNGTKETFAQMAERLARK